MRLHNSTLDGSSVVSTSHVRTAAMLIYDDWKLNSTKQGDKQTQKFQGCPEN
jgi:hypothetical protein